MLRFEPHSTYGFSGIQAVNACSKPLTNPFLYVKFPVESLNAIISIILLLIAIGVLIFIAREMESTKKRKLTGIVFFLLGILFFISQVSYLIYPLERYKNFCGLFGYYTSFFAFWVCGFYFFILPALLIYLSIVYLTRAQTENKTLLFFIPIGVVLDTLLFKLFNFNINHIPSGGMLGKVVGEFLSKYFGPFGSYTILGFSILVILFMMLKERIIKTSIQVIKSKKPEKPIKKRKKEKTEKKKPVPKPNEKVSIKKPLPQIDFKAEFLNLLSAPETKTQVNQDVLKKEAEVLSSRLAEFGVTGKVVGIESGPVISRFEFEPDPGIKVNRIANLDNDLALALKATRIRIVAPIPGKSAVGIEVPNRERNLVYIKNCILNEEFQNHPSPLAIALGEDITGQPVCDDISGMPHMLIAGTTGSGKSVCINTIITSLLYHSTYKDVRFLMIDPKRLELPMYNPIPHLLRRAITEPKNAVKELEKVVSIMELRYRDFAREGVRDIDGYNEKVRKKGGEAKPYILIIVDELADLMLTAPSEIEENITRLAQMSRAVGIHLILATQRPSVDVITGLIKANFPCRIAFQVASKTDSRTILDMNGAESLLGRGDMLFLPPGKGTPIRLHGAYISTEEVSSISNLIAKLYMRELLGDIEADLDEVINSILDEELWTIFINPRDPAFDEKRRALSNIIPTEKIDEIITNGYYPKLTELTVEEEIQPEEQPVQVDPLFPEAARLVFRHQVASVSLLQRRLNLGYARAGRIIDQLEAAGVVEPFQGSKSRKVLIEAEDELERIILKYTNP